MLDLFSIVHAAARPAPGIDASGAGPASSIWVDPGQGAGNGVVLWK